MESQSRGAGAGLSDTDASGQVQVETLKRTATAAAIAVRRKDTYRIKEELSLTGGKPNIGQLLWREMKLRDVTAKPLDGRLHLDGELSVLSFTGQRMKICLSSGWRRPYHFQGTWKWVM